LSRQAFRIVVSFSCSKYFGHLLKMPKLKRGATFYQNKLNNNAAKQPNYKPRANFNTGIVTGASLTPLDHSK